MIRPTILAACALILVSPGLAQDVRKIPATGDLPLVGRWARTDFPLWVSLGASDAGAGKEAVQGAGAEPGFRERWLMRALRERFRGVASAEVVTKLTVRHDGSSPRIHVEQGLEVRGSAASRAEAQDFLARFEAASRRSVRIELRVHEVSGEPGPNPAVAEVVGKEHYERRVLELAARHGGRLLCSPVIIARAGMPAALSILEEDSYVKDWNVESVGGDRIADPEIGIVSEGVELDLTPLFDPADESVVLSGRIEFRTIERPIPQTRVKVGDAELSVQLPLVTSWTWNGEVRLERGKDALVVKGLKAPNPQGAGLTQVEVWCLLTVIEEPGAAASGRIVSRDDKFGNIFVKWPRDVVAGDPWDQAPKEVTVYRGAEPIGKAFLTGGWVIGADPDDEFSIIAIYRLAEGAGRDGDSVR